jgi:hypothetical protein
MAKMPLKFRSTGVAFSSQETTKDCTAWSGGWTIGYIYYRAPEDNRHDEPLTCIWSIHGMPGKPPGIRDHGVSPTLEHAQASLEESWQAWLRWAHLTEQEPPGGNQDAPSSFTPVVTTVEPV